ncbi:hypothetical protein BaRGS_00021949 [Batillaria attramentaria]|uniref:Uncharacterized protein n=1 Tax=Batillaria attramentaria TaxID=370345 RepID=A0ABD0KIM4_9CAEN
MSALAARVTLFAKYRSFSCKFFTAVRRSLFSHEILGIENFKRLRIFGNDRLGDTRDQFIQNLVTARDNEAKRKGLVRDVVQLVYIAETKCEVSLIADLLKQLHCNQTEDTTSVEGGEVANDELHSSGPGRIHFGPLLMRLLYILGQTDTALNLWENEELEPLFQNVTCYLLLMDMLYEGKQYDRVVSTFTRLQDSNLSAIKYPPDCTTLALAALYQLAQHDYALNLCENAPKKNETLFRNMKTMALAGLGRIDEAISLMEDGLWTDVPTTVQNWHFVRRHSALCGGTSQARR